MDKIGLDGISKTKERVKEILNDAEVTIMLVTRPVGIEVQVGWGSRWVREDIRHSDLFLETEEFFDRIILPMVSALKRGETC